MIKGCPPFSVILCCLCSLDSRLEGWISLPSKNTKRFGWDRKVITVISSIWSFVFEVISRATESHPPFNCFDPFPFPSQYVVVSSKKILFYNTEQDREQANPFMTLDVE